MITIDARAGNLKWINEIEDLKNDVLGLKTRRFLEEVGNRGIQVARANCYEYGQNISFSKEINGRTVTVIGKDIAPITQYWYSGKVNGVPNIKAVDISPILMTEFGSGQFAVNDFGTPDGGRGTFPGQTHAFQNRWYWVGLDGETHSSSGFVPERPMYKSYMDLMYTIESIAKSIF